MPPTAQLWVCGLYYKSTIQHWGCDDYVLLPIYLVVVFGPSRKASWNDLQFYIWAILCFGVKLRLSLHLSWLQAVPLEHH